MLRALLLVTPLLVAAAPSTNHTDEKATCQKIGQGLHPARATSDQALFRRLDQLPSANEYHTVLHIENGCVKPQVVDYNAGRSERR